MPPPHVGEWTAWMTSFMHAAMTAGGTDGVERGRAPCSAAERALGDTLGAAWAKWGYNTSYESFVCAPHAFLGVIPIAVFCYFRALSSLASAPLKAFLVTLVGLALFVGELVWYYEIVDSLGWPFPVMTGINVVARLPPSGGAQPLRRLIVTAHQDRCVRPAGSAHPAALPSLRGCALTLVSL